MRDKVVSFKATTREIRTKEVFVNVCPNGHEFIFYSFWLNEDDSHTEYPQEYANYCPYCGCIL